MPLGLSFSAPGVDINMSRPNLTGACAAARSVIRRNGFTLYQCWEAARFCLRGAEPGTFNRAAAATWFKAQAVAIIVAWPGGRAPHGAAMSLASWSPGAHGRRPRLAPQPSA